MKKILVMGSDGMAGHMCAHYFRENLQKHKIYTLSRRECSLDKLHYVCDAFDAEKLTQIIKLIQPDYVLNCIGSLVQQSTLHTDQAIYLNSFLPHFLNRLSKTHGFKFIHISTDCVFDGKRGQYTENDPPNESAIYGRSKALGELIESSFVIRTSIVGPERSQNGTGLFNWFMKQKGSINGYRQCIWSGVTTLQLAKFIAFIISNNIDTPKLYHLCPNRSISKFALLLLFQQYFQKDEVVIIPTDSPVIDKSLLNNNKDIAYLIPAFEEMIEEMQEWINHHQTLYPQYQSQIAEYQKQ